MSIVAAVKAGKQRSMRANGVADWDTEPLAGFRNLPPSNYVENEDEYRLAEPALLPPVHAPLPRELVEVDYYPPTEAEEGPTYMTSTLELGNKDLPVWGERYKIVDTVVANTFSFLVSETGGGKSTQAPQVLLDSGHFNNIYMTQPRRLAARNLYERIFEELSEHYGASKAATLVSFQTAGERVGPKDARIKIVTDGIEVLRELEDDFGPDDVVLIDELHEDNENMETLFAWSRRKGVENPNLRFMYLSATIDAVDRAHWLEEAAHRPVPIIEVAGRQFKNEYREEPESDGVTETIKAALELHNGLAEKGTDLNRILVFVPGVSEIDDYINQLQKKLPPHLLKNAHIFGLHAKMSPEHQQEAIRHYKSGVSITVSTKVAQTSITIPDVKHVVSTGYERRIELTKEGYRSLVLRPISQADVRQQIGRAARVAEGSSTSTRLSSEFAYTPFSELDAYPSPQIWASDLGNTTLRLAHKGFNIARFDFYHELTEESTARAQALLRKLGALDLDNDITDIGRSMVKFPASVTAARTMVEAENRQLSQQTRAYLSVIVAAKAVGGLPYFARNVGKAWKELTDDPSSDLLAQLDIFIATQDMDKKQLAELNLDVQNVERAREQYEKIAKKVNAYLPTLLPPTPQEREAIKECIRIGQVDSMYIRSGSQYVPVGDSTTVRSISKRSVVQGHPAAIVGDPYQVEYWIDGEADTQDIVENVTAATLPELEAVGDAYGLSHTKPEGFAWRDGIFVQRRSKWLYGVKLKGTTEVVADASMPGLRETVISHVMDHPGESQNEIRRIKKQLETYQRLAKDRVMQLTQDDLVDLISRAAPEGVTDPKTIDDNLRIIMKLESISLDSYVSPERRERIRRDAPESITVAKVTLQVSYKEGVPLVNERHYTADAIARFGEEIYLPDGRQVKFIHDGKKLTLIQLQKALGILVYA